MHLASAPGARLSLLQCEALLATGKVPDDDVDLIVMSTHGRTGVGWLARGSVATRVLQRANTPILLVRPEALSAASVETSGSVAASKPR